MEEAIVELQGFQHELAEISRSHPQCTSEGLHGLNSLTTPQSLIEAMQPGQDLGLDRN